MHEVFRKIAHKMSKVMGSPWAFMTAFAVVALWAAGGALYGFTDTWQLYINTGTTILTFLMVFLIQNTQNRDAQATQLKLDELIKALKAARDDFIDVEEDDDDKLAQLEQQFHALRDKVDKHHPLSS